MASKLVIKFLNRVKAKIRALLAKPYQITYSQSGEDLIISTAFRSLDITHPTYLDIGANDPVRLSNTYLFYLEGSRGVLVEPNPALGARLARVRPGDKIVPCGIGPTRLAAVPFYMLSSSFMSTFSKHDAETACSRGGFTQIGILDVPIVTLADICKEEFGCKAPDLISIDVEGLDKEIVVSTDWDAIRPAVLCIETREFAPDWTGKTISEITDKLCSAEYDVFAATYFNTIYVDRRRRKGV